MSPENFCYWLNGYLELTKVENPNEVKLSENQMKMIQDHLKLVFKKETQGESSTSVPLNMFSSTLPLGSC